jgi:hypothetical protein
MYLLIQLNDKITNPLGFDEFYTYARQKKDIWSGIIAHIDAILTLYSTIMSCIFTDV